MSVIATDAAARKNFFRYLALPFFIYEDPYFTKSRPQGITGADLVARIVAQVRIVDNCTIKRLQVPLSLTDLEKLSGWTRKAVRYFLDKCQKLKIFGYEVGPKMGTGKGTAPGIITYIYQQLLEDEWSRGAQQGASKGHTRGHEEKNLESRIKDSCRSQATDQPKPDPMFCPDSDDDPEPRTGAGPESQTVPADEPQAASDDAGPPKSSAKKVPARSPEFMAAWNAMPKMARKRSSLELTEKQWKKLSQQQRADAVRGIALWEDNEFAKGAHRWLRDHLWEGLLDVEEGPKRSSNYSREMDELYA
jgi:hypothetical protein